MSSEKKKHAASSDTEYQYTDESVAHEPAEIEQKPKFSLHMLRDKLIERLPKKKKQRVILFLLVAVYVVYKFLSGGESTTLPPKQTPEKVISQPLGQPTTAAAPVKPTPQPATQPVTKPVITETVIPAPAKNLNEAAIPDLAVPMQVKALQADLDQIRHSVGSLESSLLSLTGSVIGLSHKMSALEKHAQAEKSVVGKQSPTQLPTYYVQSLVSGRAWLCCSAGTFTTVKVGDFLPGYGQIQKINVQNGVISTSSGRVIQYGPNDS